MEQGMRVAEVRVKGPGVGREAALRAYLSINTVKTHLRTAYRKLGVTNRADAIERARVLGLMASPTEGAERLPGDPGPDRGS